MSSFVLFFPLYLLKLQVNSKEIIDYTNWKNCDLEDILWKQLKFIQISNLFNKILIALYF